MLELGLLRAGDRDRVAALVEAGAHAARFTFVDADLDERRRRVRERNESRVVATGGDHV